MGNIVDINGQPARPLNGEDKELSVMSFTQDMMEGLMANFVKCIDVSMHDPEPITIIAEFPFGSFAITTSFFKGKSAQHVATEELGAQMEEVPQDA